MDKELLKYFKGDELAAQVWKSKYAYEGEITPDDMHRRLAKEFAKVDLKYQKEEKRDKNLTKYGLTRRDLTEDSIFELFKGFKQLIPQGSVMATLGTDKLSSLSNCFFNGHMEDNINSIFNTVKEMGQVGKRRGGTSTDLSKLRPKGATINNSANKSDGAVGFLNLIDVVGKIIGQSGRKMAMMVTMNINHPDILDFIKIKEDLSKVNNANLSLKLNDKFIKAVNNDEDYVLKFPCDFDDATSLEHKLASIPYNKLQEIRSTNTKLETLTIYVKKIKAKELWDEIIKSAWKVAEPGLLFWDNILNQSPDAAYSQYKPEGVNPCSEINLSKSDSCRLMAVNLYSFVDNPFTPDAKFNFDKFYNINYESMRLMDNLVDLEVEAVERILKKIRRDKSPTEDKRDELKTWDNILEVGKKGRRTGLGFTALGDTLAALGVKYDSKEALSIVKEIMAIKLKSELNCTIDLSILRGSFDGWNNYNEYQLGEYGIFGTKDFYQLIYDKFYIEFNRMLRYGRRNVSFSTVAPTGSVSLLTQTTSGIEPLFQPFYTRRKKVDTGVNNVQIDFIDNNGDRWQEFSVLHPKFKSWLEIQTPNMSNEDISQLSKDKLQSLFEKSPWYKSTANDINWLSRVKLQSIIQRYISHSISSTINLPSEVSVEEVSNIYMEAWKKGLKGITVYREGSRDGVLVSDKQKELVTFNENHAPKRPKKLEAKVIRFNNNYEKWVAFVGLLEDKPYEVFTGRLDNVELPKDVDTGEIIKIRDESGRRYDFTYKGGLIKGISRIFQQDYWNYGKLISSMLRHGMPLPHVVETIQTLNFDEDHINTWKNGITRALKKFIKDGKAEGVKCKQCGSEDVVFEEGCHLCKSCGDSACS